MRIVAFHIEVSIETIHLPGEKMNTEGKKKFKKNVKVLFCIAIAISAVG